MATKHLRTYETVCLTKVDMPDDKFNAMVERVQDAVKKNGSGEWLFTDDWGRAKIAYPIKKDGRAKWTYFRFKSLPDGVSEVQRTLGINEFVLRAATFQTQENGSDYESLRAGMAKEISERDRRDWRDDRRPRRPRRDDHRGGGRYNNDRGPREEEGAPAVEAAAADSDSSGSEA
ncbi:MAG TPA: 30S ribosomal protein S6 [Bdellovibrionota bacterium]|nr:30S ribosomal protein S6 [Bdellovibrionota bacterium]